MAVDKVLQRIEAKLDALLAANDIDPLEYPAAKAAARPPRELTPAQQQAIDNAPKHIEAVRTTGQPPAPGAPVTPPAPPKGEEEPDPDDDDDDDGGQLPDDAVGNATVVTKQPDGTTTTQTKPVGELKDGDEPGGIALGAGASAHVDDLPWPGYASMTVDQVLAHAKTVEHALRQRALAYERKHRKRADVIQPLVNWNS